MIVLPLNSSCLTQCQSTAGCPVFIHFLEVLVYSYEALFDITFFLNKQTHKVTQVSSGFHCNCGNRHYLNQFPTFSFFLANFAHYKKKSPLKSHREIINIFNYLHKIMIQTVPPMMIKAGKSYCPNGI